MEPIEGIRKLMVTSEQVEAAMTNAVILLKNRDAQIDIALAALTKIATCPVNMAAPKLHAIAIDAIQAMKRKHTERS